MDRIAGAADTLCRYFGHPGCCPQERRNCRCWAAAAEIERQAQGAKPKPQLIALPRRQ